MASSTNPATSKKNEEFSSISLRVDSNSDAASASVSAASFNATFDNVATLENLSTMSCMKPLELTSNGNVTVSFAPSQIPPNSTALTDSVTDWILPTSTSATKKFVTTLNPCSNDNPNWDSATQLCPNSTTDFQFLFDGAFTTPSAPSVTTTTISDYPTEQALTNRSNEVEFPSAYSCTVESSPAEQAEGNKDGNNDSETETLHLRFHYEIYTPPNPTADMINATLSEFERKLVYGVAHAAGLVNCQNQFVTRSARHILHGKHKLRQRNSLRRSLQRNVLTSLADNTIVQVSMNPLDIVDTTLLACTSQEKLDDPNECTSIHGFMTAWIAKEKAGRIRQLAVESYSDYETPEKFLLSTIQSYIEQNQTAYLTDDLLRVVYVGERVSEPNNTDQDVLVRPITPQADTEAANNIASKYIGIGIASVFFAVLFAGLVYSYYQKRQSERNLQENVEMDMEVGNSESHDDAGWRRESSKSSGSLRDEDGAFPSVKKIHAAVDSNRGLIQESPSTHLLKESDVAQHDSSIWTSLDPNIPADLGLRGKVCSDEYPVTRQMNQELNDSQTIMRSTIMNSENGDHHEDTYSSGSESDEPLHAVPTREEDNMSPSEATEKMGNTAQFVVEDAHNASEEDDISSLDSHDNVNIEGMKEDSLPSLV